MTRRNLGAQTVFGPKVNAGAGDDRCGGPLRGRRHAQPTQGGLGTGNFEDHSPRETRPASPCINADRLRAPAYKPKAAGDKHLSTCVPEARETQQQGFGQNRRPTNPMWTFPEHSGEC